MRRVVRARPWYFLLLIGVFSGCFETKLIPADSDAGGAPSGGEGGAQQAGGSAGEGEDAGATAGGSSSGGRPVASGGAATGGAGNAKGGAANTGGTGNAKGGAAATGGAAPTGGAATGGATTGGAGGASGGSGGQVLSSVDWLTFVDSDAPSSSSPNGALGINGLLYGYADSCAVLNWDAQQRCASGTLCNPADGANWGIAVGFDFKNTGATGVPPDTKQLWDPNDVGALGVAWEITGTAPGLQVWMLNMDPVWAGQCSAASCDIAGPPDGNPTPPLLGQLLFSNMRKDDWGSSGVRYIYDPAKAYALQFKLPAIVVGPVSFSFCVKRVGIIH